MSDRLQIGEIARILQGEAALYNPDFPVDYLILDSRTYRGDRNVLFFALRGSNHDGHEYVNELYSQGVRNFVLERNMALPADCNCIVVKDSLRALQKLARHRRKNSGARIIAITGSNGKTIVKEWLSQILQGFYRLTKNPGSFNSQVGVPLSLWQLKESDEIGIFEAGISQRGEMQHLREMIEPEIGIFTNIGSAHDQFFPSREAKAAEKLQLFEYCKTIVYCSDQPIIHQLLKDDSRGMSWSRSHKSADLYISEIVKGSNHSTIKAVFRGELTELEIPFSDAPSVENAIHCWLCCLHLGLNTAALLPAFAQLQRVALRLELKSGRNQSIIINDSYNSDLESLRAALDFAAQQARHRKLLLVLSDMQQSGMSGAGLYREVGKILREYAIEEFIGVGPDIFRYREEMPPQSSFFPDSASLLLHLRKLDLHQKAILLKGARAFRFEDISQRLEEKSHETIMEIHLDRMVHNLNYYRSLLKPGVKIMAMVKAFSYGSGSYEIASLLQFHKVDYLAVAYTDEGVELRKAGIELPILVLNTEPSSFSDLLHYRLEPEIFSFRILRLFQQALAAENITEPYPIHLKLDSGMHRLGFEAGDIDELIQLLRQMPEMKIRSIFSHLSAADEAKHLSFTQRQISDFQGMAQTIEQAFGPCLKHILNSSGIENHLHAQMDMVRLGIGLHGISSSEQQRKFLQPVAEFKAMVSQVKSLEKGDAVGYGLSYIAPRPMQIAIITAGYADGLRRSLSNGKGQVFIQAKAYPVVGRVCMDMCMIDISGSKIKEGDEVEIFGSHLSIYALAEAMDTIPYEVLTGISQRVKRIYFLE